MTGKSPWRWLFSTHSQASALRVGVGFGQAFGLGELENFGRQRVLFSVGLAWHLQAPADFFPQLVNALSASSCFEETSIGGLKFNELETQFLSFCA
jgi:hypothetical protein